MSNQLDLKNKSTLELKAIVYDVSKLIQNYNQVLNVVNQEITEREQREMAGLANQAKEAPKNGTEAKVVDLSKEGPSKKVKSTKKPD